MPIRIGSIDARKLQRRVTDIDLGVRQHADRFQCGAGVAHGASVGAMALACKLPVRRFTTGRNSAAHSAGIAAECAALFPAYE
jgi:hypothetical protein